ncbi:MAG: hypothetical protein ABDH66_05195 [Bacteroidia bacterium]
MIDWVSFTAALRYIIVRVIAPMQLNFISHRIKERMKRNIYLLGYLLSISLLGYAQPYGENALGIAISKDGIRAFSLRFAVPDNPALNFAFLMGTEAGGGITGGIALQQYLSYAGGCGGGACVRGNAIFLPYLEGGVRIRKVVESPHVDVLGHLGLGVSVPLGRLELFSQGNLYTLLSSAKPLTDLIGGFRWKF